MAPRTEQQLKSDESRRLAKSTAKRMESHAARMDSAPATPGSKMHRDGWTSLYTGMGVTGRDKTESFSFKSRTQLNYAQMQALYRQNWLGGRLVDDLVTDATKAGFCFQVEKNEKLQKKVHDAWKSLKVKEMLANGLRWALVFRGAVALLLTKDEVKWAEGETPMAILSRPLEAKGLKRIYSWLVVDARYATPDISKYTEDPESENFGLPEYYQVTPYGQSTNTTTYRVHWSRLLRFDGVPTDMQARLSNMTWGDSIYERAYDTLRRYGMAFDGTAITVSEFAQGVLKMKDLSDNLASDDIEKIQARVLGFKMGLSANGVALIDAEMEEYIRLGQPVSGLDSLLNLFKQEVAGMSRIAESRLWGSQAGKLAGPEADSEVWHEYVNGWQELDLIPVLQRFTRMLLASEDGPSKGKDPGGWEIVPNPIVKPDAEKAARVRKVVAEGDKIYWDINALESSEIRKRHAGPDFNSNLTLDPEITAALELAEKAARDAGEPLQGRNTPIVEPAEGEEPEPGEEGEEPEAGKKSPPPEMSKPAAAEGKKPAPKGKAAKVK